MLQFKGACFFFLVTLKMYRCHQWHLRFDGLHCTVDISVFSGTLVKWKDRERAALKLNHSRLEVVLSLCQGAAPWISGCFWISPFPPVSELEISIKFLSLIVPPRSHTTVFQFELFAHSSTPVVLKHWYMLDSPTKLPRNSWSLFPA